jgi:hypothetical protein
LLLCEIWCVDDYSDVQRGESTISLDVAFDALAEFGNRFMPSPGAALASRAPKAYAGEGLSRIAAQRAFVRLLAAPAKRAPQPLQLFVRARRAYIKSGRMIGRLP